jgi:hypothetical protein
MKKGNPARLGRCTALRGDVTKAATAARAADSAAIFKYSAAAPAVRVAETTMKHQAF